jgi:hypothetical protein
VSSHTQTRDEKAALKIYAAFLHERNNVLSELARTSREMRLLLESDGLAEIKDLLSSREQECLKYADLCKSQTTSEDVLLRNAENAVRSGKQESASVALSVLSLYEDSQDLASEIMTCQSECESILKNRLKSTAQALQTSARRRKLDTAYGPACRHDIPIFMDKQT